MKLCTIIIISLLLSLASPSHAGLFLPDQKSAQKSYKEKNYDRAYKHWKALEPYENPKTYLGLGKLHMRGLGVEQDYKIALQYFMKAAEQNNKQAQYEIAYAYEKGRGVTKNIDKAQQWYAISATNGYTRAEKKLAALNADYEPVAFQKEKKENYKIDTSIRSQFVVEDNLSLDNNKDGSSALITEGQIRTTYEPIEDLRLHTQIRAVSSIGNARSNDDDYEETDNENFVEVRQAWFEKKNLMGHAPLSLKAGRQRFREERGNWWNRDLDAVKISYNSSLTSGFLAMGQNLSKYRLGSNNDLEKDEKERLRFLGEASHQISKDHALQARFLYEYDHSNTPIVGQLFNVKDRDDTDYNILWSGLRATGYLSPLVNHNIKKIKYIADIATAIGTEEIVLSQSTATSNIRSFSAVNERDVLGWAFDGRLEAYLDLPYDPIFIFGYTYASGDDGSGTNNAFRQAGLESNTSLYPENRVATSLRQYGEVLRPELSNIHILNMGVNFPIWDKGDLNLHYYSYWRDNNKTGLLSNGIDQNLIGNDHHIGQAFDISTNYSLDDLLQKSFNTIRKANLRLKLGSFYSGQAYGSNKNELAFKGTAEIKVKF
jgi:alginate production protein